VGELQVRNTRLLAFVLLLGSGSTAAIVPQIAWSANHLVETPSAFFWLVLAVLVALIPFRRITGIGTVTLSPILLLTMLVLYGTGITIIAGLLAGMAAMWSSRTGNTRFDCQRAVLNSGKHIIGLLAAGYLLWGSAFHTGVMQAGLTQMMPIRFLIAYGAYVSAKGAVFSVALWLRVGRDPLEAWKANFGREKILTWITPFAAYLLAVIYLTGGALLISILVAIVLVRILTTHDKAQVNMSCTHLVDALRHVRIGDMTQLTGETQREVELAVGLAQKMRLPHRNLELVEQAAMLHNIGYIAADAKTVSKSTQLTPEEIEALKQHPHDSMMILKGVNAMEGVCHIVHCHHESPDGNGFPRGIEGDQIPLEAAIIKIAEAHVAMTSPRLYRKEAFKKDAALDIIAQATGSCFDPIAAYFMFEMMGRADLSSTIATEFGAPTGAQIKVRLYKPIVDLPKAVSRRRIKTPLLIGSGMIAAAFGAMVLLRGMQPSRSMSMLPSLITGSISGIATLVLLLALAALKPVRLPWKACISWAPAIVIAATLAGGPVYSITLGCAFIGWAILLDTLGISPHEVSERAAHTQHRCGRLYLIPTTGSKDDLDPRLPSLMKRILGTPHIGVMPGYGLVLTLAGCASWLAYYLGTSISHAADLGWGLSRLLSMLLGLGGFYVVETLLQSSLLVSSELSPGRIWQRNYLGSFPEPLSYAAFGYVILLGSNLLGLWATVPLFMIPILWRHRALSKRIDQQKTAYDLIKAVARTVDGKHRYTAGHSAAVAELAAEIGREMNKSEPFIEQLEQAAYWHDLGKVSWPNQVIRQPASSDEEEQEIYKWTHPDVGAEIATKAGAPCDVIEIVRSHHEHYDGGGYFRRLRQDEIPLGARILSVADSFDAMIHDGRQRHRFAIGAAIHEIKNRGGTQFDLSVICAFARVLDHVDHDKLARAVAADIGDITQEPVPVPATP
jgi:putative nucleotidyltransferase with HDIG domain